MSISAIPIIVDRIKIATRSNPIAVFAVPGDKVGRMDAVFGRTVTTQKRILNKDPFFVGCFHSGMNILIVTQKMLTAYHANRNNQAI